MKITIQAKIVLIPSYFYLFFKVVDVGNIIPDKFLYYILNYVTQGFCQFMMIKN